MLKYIGVAFTLRWVINFGRLESSSVDQNANIVLFVTVWLIVLLDLSCLSFAVPLLTFQEWR